MAQDPQDIPVDIRVNEVLADYLVRVDRGEQIDREEFVCQHPEIAEELRSYFADSDAVGQIVVQSEENTDLHSQNTSVMGPRVLGNYVILRRIGEGGMGQVYKARHQRMKRVVALKILPKVASGSPDAVRRFQQEVEAAARLAHPNIVTAYDADEANGVHFLVMEYVEGCDLARLVRQRGALPLAGVLDYVIQAARGLEYAHAHGVIHRDIKPSNLLVDCEGRVKVLDMGLARLNREADVRAPAESLTNTGTVMGTVDYMAPEQAEDTRQADARSDVYSLGCTLYYLLTGRPVYNADTSMKKLLAHREAAIPLLGPLRDHVPGQLDKLFARMLAKNPAERPASMREVIAEMERCREWLAASMDDERICGGKPSDSDETVSEIAKRSVAAAAGVATQKVRGLARKTMLIGAIAVGFGLAGLLLGVIFKFSTAEGTLVVEVNEPGAQVEVTGGKFTITTPDSKEPVNLQVEPGKHTLRVTKGGFESFTREFTMRSRGQETVRVVLQPIPPSLPMASQQTDPVDVPPSVVQPRAEEPSKRPVVATDAVHKTPSSLIGPDGNWKLPSGAPQPAIAPFDAKKAREHQEAWAKYLGVPVEMTNSIGMKLVLIPPGEFMMGATAEEIAWATEDARVAGSPADYSTRETPRHRVRLSRPYYLGVHEVTQGEYATVMGLNPSSYSSEAGEYPGIDNDRYPVETVSWNDVSIFCKRLSELPAEKESRRAYHLPTEAQWEHACRGGNVARWNDTDELAKLKAYAWYTDNSRTRTWPVARKTTNSWGLFDMLGNVAEWCQDWDCPDYYGTSPAVDPGGPPVGSSYIVRGGGWHSPSRDCRSASRAWDGRPSRCIGFRVLCEVPSAPRDLGRGEETVAVAEFTPDGGLIQADTRWNDLLPIVNPERDAVLGDWQLSRGQLHVTETPEICKRIEIPVIPTGGYEFRVAFQRRAGAGELALILPVQSTSIVLLIRNPNQGPTILESVQEQFASGRESTRPVDLSNNQSHTVLARVQSKNDQAEVHAELDGVPLLAWRGPQRALAPQEGYTMPRGKCLGIGGQASVVFYAAELRMLDGRAERYSRPTNEWVDPVATIRARGGSIEANEKGQVLGCDLGDAVRVTDRELSHLTKLPELKSLRLAGNGAISDKGMVHLAGMTSLRHLDLGFTIVGDEGLRYIAQLRNLNWLNLHCTRVSDAGLPHLKPLQGMETLSVGWSRVTDQGLVHLRELKGLKELDLYFLDIGDVGAEHLAGLTGLETLHFLGAARLTDQGLGRLSLLKNIRDLSLGDAGITGIGLKGLAKFSGLEKLRLDACPRIADDDLQHLSPLKLTSLGLNRTKITNAGLKHLVPLKQLRDLQLNQTRIDDAASEHLAKMTAIRHLVLTETAVTVAGVVKLRAALPTCQIDVDAKIEAQPKGQ